jgi:hypothetical protein
MKSLLKVLPVLLSFWLVSGGANAVTISGFDSIDIDYQKHRLTARDNNTVNLFDGADVFSLTMLDDSRLNMSGGGVKFIKAFGNAQLAIDGGSVFSMHLWGDTQTTIQSAQVSTIWAMGDSTLSLSNVTGLESLFIFGDGQIRLEATDVELNGKMLTGYWEGGDAFSIRAISLTGNKNFFNNVSVVNPVPVPAAAWMFGTAIISIMVVGRRRSIAAAA